jgi:hypothetical protein
MSELSAESRALTYAHLATPLIACEITCANRQEYVRLNSFAMYELPKVVGFKVARYSNRLRFDHAKRFTLVASFIYHSRSLSSLFRL